MRNYYFIDEIDISKDDLKEGLDKFNTELTNLEWDLPHVDKQYSKIIYKLIDQDLIDVPALKWMNDREEEESSDIFIKIIIRIVELKLIDSNKNLDETQKYVEVHSFISVIERIKEWLLEEELIENYKEEMDSYETVYKLLSLA